MNEEIEAKFVNTTGQNEILNGTLYLINCTVPGTSH